MAAARAEAAAQGMEDRFYGDQMLFTVFNDRADHARVWTMPPIGLEVRLTAFAFRGIRGLENAIFMKYEIVHKGTENLTEAYIAQFFDPDLGQAGDDAIGLDTTLQVGYVYNIDPADDVYQTRIPCFGCDWLQGPMIPAPGETATAPGATPLFDYKVLPLTGFAFYLGGGPNPISDTDLQSKAGLQEAYWYCSGFHADGSPWQDPSAGNKVTRWPVAGDPVTGQGWIQSLTWPGADMRFCLAAGPFTLEVGKSYSILLACVVGVGEDHLQSIQVMKKYDQIAQSLYENNFHTAPPAPRPVIQVGQLDRKITFSWDDTAVSYVFPDNLNLDPSDQPTQYTFQGYKFYQAPAPTGPWKLMHQWDKVDGITRIWDDVYDPVWSEYIYTPVEDGKDTGLVFNLILSRDALNDQPLINGTPYYFALTTYAYNPYGCPRVLENEIACLTAIPQRPVLNIELSSNPGDTLPFTHHGPGAGRLMTQIINPALITGHDYRLTFKYLQPHQIGWDLFDVNAGRNVLNNQTHQTSEDDYGQDESYLSVAGFMLKVITPKAGLKTYQFEPTENRWLTWINSDFWQLEGFNGAIGWGNHFMHGSAVDAAALHHVELRFAAGDTLGIPVNPQDVNISFAYRYLREAGAPAKPEFAEFIIHPGAGFFYQDLRPIIVSAWDLEASPPRRLALAFLESNTPTGKVDSRWFPGRNDTEGGNNAAWEILYVLASDYAPTPKSEYTTKNLLTDQAQIDIMWVCTAGRRGQRVPQSGDKLVIDANKVNSPADTFLIATAGAEKKTGMAVARKRLQEIQVFPNPCFGINPAERSAAEQFVTFSNLPEKCIVRIFSLSGQMVRSLLHDDGTPFEHWDLKNEHGRTVGSGLYVVYIHIDEVGERLIKLAIIDRE
ncbi:hypothetical protein L0128_12615 [candidate division KSB1 bacterium]|nr:hypothetical protein [candidate division KSB1 bacterium]